MQRERERERERGQGGGGGGGVLKNQGSKPVPDAPCVRGQNSVDEGEEGTEAKARTWPVC